MHVQRKDACMYGIRLQEEENLQRHKHENIYPPEVHPPQDLDLFFGLNQDAADDIANEP